MLLASVIAGLASVPVIAMLGILLMVVTVGSTRAARRIRVEIMAESAIVAISVRSTAQRVARTVAPHVARLAIALRAYGAENAERQPRGGMHVPVALPARWLAYVTPTSMPARRALPAPASGVWDGRAWLMPAPAYAPPAPRKRQRKAQAVAMA